MTYPFRLGAGALSLAALPHSALAQAADPHAGHTMAMPMEDPATATTAEADPHAGHDMGSMTMLPGRLAPAIEAGEGSGTSLLPLGEGMMRGLHFGLGGGWRGMAHGYVWPIATHQSGPRGDDKLYAQSMALVTVERPLGAGRLQLRTMLSAEPLMSARGYPNLLATGETAGGEPLVDRQHPHDLFMELAGRVDLPVAANTSAFLYGGPVGEPALGPSAFMHRGSATYNPEAPITHHWFDSTHITYGVVTAGLQGRRWQLEGSAFRGREPDERRWDIETPRLDSWSVRASTAPSPSAVLSVSTGRLTSPEASHPQEDEQRTTASVSWANGRGLTATLAGALKDRRPGPTLPAGLAEANWELGRHVVFGRAEVTRNDELVPDEASPLHERPFTVGKVQAGYAYRLPLGRAPVELALGGSLSTLLLPAALRPSYGDALGATAFARLSFAR